MKEMWLDDSELFASPIGARFQSHGDARRSLRAIIDATSQLGRYATPNGVQA